MLPLGRTNEQAHVYNMGQAGEPHDEELAVCRRLPGEDLTHKKKGGALVSYSATGRADARGG